MKNRSVFDKMFASKRFNIALSLLLAVLTWFVVALVIDPEKTGTVKNVPVDFDYNAATYESIGLEILSKQKVYVTVVVKGDGYILNQLKTDDFIVYPAYGTQVNGPGLYELPLEIKKKSSTNAYEIQEIAPQFVSVQFDKVVDKKMPITVNVTGFETETGYFMDQPVAAPAEVNLHGPESAINRISKVVANVTLSEKRKESAVVLSSVELQDKDGNIISPSENFITIDTEQVEVRLSVLEERIIPLTVEYTNVPQGFDTSTLKYKLSNDALRVAGPTSLWDTLPSLNIGYIDLSKYDGDKDFNFPIKLPDGFKNMDNLLSVSVSFDTEHMATKQVNVSDIRSSGSPPKGITLIIPPNARVNNVTLVGPQEVLDEITATGVIAQIDAPALSQINGQQEVPVRILVPGASEVFATGVYTVLCNTKVQ